MCVWFLSSTWKHEYYLEGNECTSHVMKVQSSERLLGLGVRNSVWSTQIKLPGGD